MSDTDAADLIFAPGFSTASAITAVSGRGVGLDAVRVAVERLGGRVSVESTAGSGTTVRFIVPFTVMMTRVMTFDAGGQVFGIPIEVIVETVRITRSEIHAVGAGQAVVLRDRVVPVISLGSVLGHIATVASVPHVNLIVVALGDQLAALEVDRLGTGLDVMLKPLDGLLSGTPGVAGTTLLGDGRLLIVLDMQDVLD
jgi:two-component system chemotaxis sensor kinase CheA